MSKDMDFCHSRQIYPTNMNNYWIPLENRTKCCKNCFQKVVHEAAEATGEFIGNKIADKIVKLKPAIDENSRNVEEIVIPAEKIQKILNKLRPVL